MDRKKENNKFKSLLEKVMLYFKINQMHFLLNSKWFLFCRHLLQYQEPIPCEQLVNTLCDLKQAYTQFGGNCKSQFKYFLC